MRVPFEFLVCFRHRMFNVCNFFLCCGVGPWRWFDESMLDCCEPLEKVKERGISFGKLVSLAHCAGADVEAFRTNHLSVDDFRKYVVRCSTSDDCHLISSYNRATFKQVGLDYSNSICGFCLCLDNMSSCVSLILLLFLHEIRRATCLILSNTSI